MSFCKGGMTLGSGDLLDASGIPFAEGVILAETSGTVSGLTFASPATLSTKTYFASGVLFAESSLRALFGSTDNVLVSGEAFNQNRRWTGWGRARIWSRKNRVDYEQGHEAPAGRLLAQGRPPRAREAG